MGFPSYVDVFLLTRDRIKYNETEEGAKEYLRHLQLMELLSKALGFSYKVRPISGAIPGILFGEIKLMDNLQSRAFYPNKVSDVTFATTKPGYESNSMAIVNPFAIEIWILFLLSAVIMTFAIFFIFRGRLTLLSVLFYTMMTFLGKHRNWNPKSKAQALMVLTWSVGMTFLSLGYGSVLLSFLTLPSAEKGVRNFYDLHEAISNGRVTAFQLEGSFTNLEFAESGDEKLKFIAMHIAKNAVKIGNNGDFLEIMKPNVAVIGTRDVLEVLYGEDTYFISEDSTSMCLFSMYSFFLCCTEQVNQAIHWIWAAGLQKKIFEDYKFNKMSITSRKFYNLNKQEKYSIQPLSLSSFSGPFYVLIMGHILATITFLKNYLPLSVQNLSRTFFNM